MISVHESLIISYLKRNKMYKQHNAMQQICYFGFLCSAFCGLCLVFHSFISYETEMLRCYQIQQDLARLPLVNLYMNIEPFLLFYSILWWWLLVSIFFRLLWCTSAFTFTTTTTTTTATTTLHWWSCCIGRMYLISLFKKVINLKKKKKFFSWEEILPDLSPNYQLWNYVTGYQFLVNYFIKLSFIYPTYSYGYLDVYKTSQICTKWWLNMDSGIWFLQS